MSRRSETKRISHDRIRSSAATALRLNGIEAMSVHEIMREAGFTVGGFYAHYKSRGEMVEDAFDAAVTERSEVVRELLDGKSGSERLSAFIAAYLADEHADNPSTACPWAASLSDLQRAGAPLRKMVTDRFERAAAGLHPDRRQAIATLSLAFSSLILMRTVTDPALRDEIAAAARFAVACMDTERAGDDPTSSAPDAGAPGEESAGEGDRV